MKSPLLNNNTYHGKINPKELLMASTTVVKNRTGAVLGRQIILKSDHFDSGVNEKPDIHLMGAPNFRLADLDIFGVAQPTTAGIQTILKLFSDFTIWVSTREEPMVYINQMPYVIRDFKNPFQNVNTYKGISVFRLEQVEKRLKEDILLEMKRWNGLLLVHNEKEHLEILPTWVSIDSIQMPQEVFETLQKSGYNVKYERIPISPDQAPDNKYIDEYNRVVGGANINTPIVFNCGMGIGRTTCASQV